MADHRTRSDDTEQAAPERDRDQDQKRSDEQLKKAPRHGQPRPAKKVGDRSPNPLPDDLNCRDAEVG